LQVTNISNSSLLKITGRSIFPNILNKTTWGGGTVRRMDHRVTRFTCFHWASPCIWNKITDMVDQCWQNFQNVNWLLLFSCSSSPEKLSKKVPSTVLRRLRSSFTLGTIHFQLFGNHILVPTFQQRKANIFLS